MASPVDPRNTSRDDSLDCSETQAPNRGGARTPPRVASSSSLYGEDFVISSKPSSSGLPEHDFLFSPSLLDRSEATTPPSIPQAPQSLSPPPINGENASWASVPVTRRPPRAPNMNLRFGGGGGGSTGGHHHNRGLSGGDASLLSALTDSDYEAGVEASKLNTSGIPVHSRNSSWDGVPAGGDVKGMSIDVQHDLLQQPILDDIFDAPSSERNEDTPALEKESFEETVEHILHKEPSTHSTRPGISRHRHTTRLQEYSEFESEAENLILKAIESEAASVNRQTDIMQALFPTIPENEAHLFDSKSCMEQLSSISHDSGHAPSPLHKATTFLQALHQANSGSSTLVVTHPEKAINYSTAYTDRFIDSAAKKMATSLKQAKSSKTANSLEQVAELPIKNNASDTPEGIVKVEDDVETDKRRKTGISGLVAKVADISSMRHRINYFKEQWEIFGEFLQPRKATLRKYFMNLLVWIIAPSMFLANVMFYFTENQKWGMGESNSLASASWWLLFVGVRNPLMLGLAKLSETVLVDHVAVHRPLFIRYAGPGTALFCSHSKGTPSISFFFGAYSIFLLFGSSPFKRHWLHWQDLFDIFNETNPSGDVTNRDLYLKFLLSFMFTGISITVKRVWTGQYLGGRLLLRYSDQLTALMEELALISEIAVFSRHKTNMDDTGRHYNDNARGPYSVHVGDDFSTNKIDPSLPTDSPTRANMEQSTEIPLKILDLLDEWEEPERVQTVQTQDYSVKDVIQFRQAYLLMETSFPFSTSFGVIYNRKSCIASARNVYIRLVQRQQMGKGNGSVILSFGMLASSVALGDDGKLDRIKAKKLKKIFPPDCANNLTMLQWCKSCDAVYKKMRFLNSSIHNASQIDKAYEHILNWAFYAVLGILVCGILGVSALSFILSLSSIIVAFAFAIGPASSQYFEGVLMILVRRPYDIGDRVAISDVDQGTNVNGSNGWIVENIDLFTTTMRFGASRERCTIANGSIARSRIINMTRSDKAMVYIPLKFSTDEPYSKVKVFKKSVETFVQERPQEWVSLSSIRANRVETELGYIEYVIVLQHRDAWSKVGIILESKADVSSFCLEVQKQLGMRYSVPPLPVNLDIGTGDKSKDPPVLTAKDSERSTSTLPPASPSTMDARILAVAQMFETKKAK